MAKIRIIKKNNDCSMEYEVGDICEVTGTWYGGCLLYTSRCV